MSLFSHLWRLHHTAQPTTADDFPNESMTRISEYRRYSGKIPRPDFRQRSRSLTVHEDNIYEIFHTLDTYYDTRVCVADEFAIRGVFSWRCKCRRRNCVLPPCDPRHDIATKKIRQIRITRFALHIFILYLLINRLMREERKCVQSNTNNIQFAYIL